MGELEKKDVYTVADVAELFQCHRTTITNHIESGQIKAAKLGRVYRISRQELERYWSESGGGNLFMEDRGIT